MIGLYLIIERGYTGSQVQLAHMALAAKSKQWPPFTPPPTMSAVTVRDVLEGIDADNHRKRIYDWANSVLKSWGNSHASIADFATQYLNSA